LTGEDLEECYCGEGDTRMKWPFLDNGKGEQGSDQIYQRESLVDE
jgi:hypothetical protein